MERGFGGFYGLGSLMNKMNKWIGLFLWIMLLVFLAAMQGRI
jgi:hypothetical protein